MRMESTAADLEFVLVPCAACSALNRIPRRRLSEDPKCGRCHDKVFPRKPVTVTDASWKAQVDECPITVLVDFWADWCGPCKAIAPVLEQIASERGGRLKIVKLNVDQNPKMAARFGVRSIPNLVLLRGPMHLDQMAGAMPKASLDAWLDRFI